jgi:catalase
MADKEDELYVHERYKFGSKEKELAEFNEHAKRVIAVQRALAARHSPGNPRRVFHAKAHACIAGSLTLMEGRPQITRHGIFRDGGKLRHNVLARFSSGVGFDQHDLKPDVRGLALKIFGVSEESIDGEERGSRTVDFLMTNSTNPFGRDHEEFVRFMEANVNPLRLIAFLAEHPRVALSIAKATLKITASLAIEQYWSGHPYLLGPQQAMKFNVRPIAGSEHEVGTEHDPAVSPSRFDSNYLSLELRERLRREPIRFVFSLQLERDLETTPIEVCLMEWEELESP